MSVLMSSSEIFTSLEVVSEHFSLLLVIFYLNKGLNASQIEAKLSCITEHDSLHMLMQDIYRI